MARGKPFQKGFDARRHLLTTEDRAKGYAQAPAKIKSRIRSLYRGYNGVSRMNKTGETVYREYEDLTEA